jgi:hypothetical protein
MAAQNSRSACRSSSNVRHLRTHTSMLQLGDFRPPNPLRRSLAGPLCPAPASAKATGSPKRRWREGGRFAWLTHSRPYARPNRERARHPPCPKFSVRSSQFEVSSPTPRRRGTCSPHPSDRPSPAELRALRAMAAAVAAARH